jgi:hypothetical protein
VTGRVRLDNFLLGLGGISIVFGVFGFIATIPYALEIPLSVIAFAAFAVVPILLTRQKRKMLLVALVFVAVRAALAGLFWLFGWVGKR